MKNRWVATKARRPLTTRAEWVRPFPRARTRLRGARSGSLEQAKPAVKRAGDRGAGRVYGEGHPRAEAGDDVTDDLRLAWRDARRRPLATAAMACMLALGMGLTTALFGAVDAVLLRPLPISDADRVVGVWTRDVDRGYAHFPITRRAWQAVEANATTLAGVAAVDA